jgi:hypothetical protein
MRRGRLAPDHPAHLETVHAGQVQVEQHEVDATPHGVESLLAGAGDLDVQPHLLELIRDRLADVRVVFDQQHPSAALGHRRSHRHGWPRVVSPHGFTSS